MKTGEVIQATGQRAEFRVSESLGLLPPPWQSFPTVEWRLLQRDGESVGEADVVVFHPQHGLIVIEIKAGAVYVRDGQWHYASGLPMKTSPFSQARRNRYALQDKLRQVLGKSADELTVTHAVWFPEVNWQGPLPGTEMPSRAFLLDRQTLADPESALLRIFREAAPESVPWSRSQQQALKRLLAVDCQLLVPLAVQVDDAVGALEKATEQQLAVLRMLRTQPRLLIEGGAGSGKTLLACILAREHAAMGRSVLLTCFNRSLAQYLSQCLADMPAIRVSNFHELVRQLALDTGIPFDVPADEKARRTFFQETVAEILLSASEFYGDRFDTVIVDEAADFSPTWWLGLEALGAQNFSWYCFFDLQQNIYQRNSAWEPPFSGLPMTLDVNLRNPRPVGDFAARIGQAQTPMSYRLQEGPTPTCKYAPTFAAMAVDLRALISELLRKDSIRPEQIVVLAPYRHTNEKSGWAVGLEDAQISTDMVRVEAGKVRVGTIQGFKGLEADVVILAGIDKQAVSHPDWLYVGASRAKAALYVLALESSGLESADLR